MATNKKTTVSRGEGVPSPDTAVVGVAVAVSVMYCSTSIVLELDSGLRSSLYYKYREHLYEHILSVYCSWCGIETTYS